MSPQLDSNPTRLLRETEVLKGWQAGAESGPALRGVALLESLGPRSDGADWANVPIGWCDARLLELREALLGPEIEALATCPHCARPIELVLRVADLRRTPEREVALEVALEGCVVSFRSPTAADLHAVLGAAESAAPRRRLLARCVESARSSSGNELGLSEVPETVLALIEERMADADPQAAPQLAIDCPWCSLRSVEAFDAIGFFWIELQNLAQRLIREVHELASAYGWAESDLLAMGAARRRAYLDLLRP